MLAALDPGCDYSIGVYDKMGEEILSKMGCLRAQRVRKQPIFDYRAILWLL